MPARRQPVSQPPSIRPATAVCPNLLLYLINSTGDLHCHESEYSTPPNQPTYQRPIDRSKAAFHPPPFDGRRNVRSVEDPQTDGTNQRPVHAHARAPAPACVPDVFSGVRPGLRTVVFRCRPALTQHPRSRGSDPMVADGRAPAGRRAPRGEIEKRGSGAARGMGAGARGDGGRQSAAPSGKIRSRRARARAPITRASRAALPSLPPSLPPPPPRAPRGACTPHARPAPPRGAGGRRGPAGTLPGARRRAMAARRKFDRGLRQHMLCGVGDVPVFEPPRRSSRRDRPRTSPRSARRARYGLCRVRPPKSPRAARAADKTLRDALATRQRAHEARGVRASRGGVHEGARGVPGRKGVARWRRPPACDGEGRPAPALRRGERRAASFVGRRRVWREVVRAMGVGDERDNAPTVFRALYEKHLLAYEQHCAPVVPRRTRPRWPARRAAEGAVG